MKQLTFGVVFLLGLVQVSCEKDNDDHYEAPPKVKMNVFQSAGDSATIVTQINNFRTQIGDPVNNVPGVTVGRREVNWDGVPPNFTNNDQFPADFFNLTDPAGANGRKRGLVYTAASLPLRLDSTSFSQLDVSYADEFIPFSQKKLLISTSSNVSEVEFKVAGTNTNAFVKGFGIIFSDVDDANSTSLEFFNGNTSLGVVKAPVKKPGAAFSFLGVFFPESQVTRIRITAGNAKLAAGVKDLSDGGTKDLVAYDDFFYSEPLALQ
ncbi:hypothetical protein GFS24_24790 [Chitinophaga sp. SYP-B3965]|uniref:hypothetical protein n=1 Tax=Chitinophaga sp. SYP-B3965 TaxID=2663120 RepID=UPI001299B1DB|nr:hypothetical protein [Chitinophaga sp. SYP-B3965]MRG48357.1 hypothetical protein [Chitinophaga sp. SYP-B3965]